MITLQNITRQFGSRKVYDGVSAAIHPSHRTAVTGPNGAGKTMLLRLIMGLDTVDSGTVVVPQDLRLGYLPQELEFDDSISALDYVLEPFAHLFEVENAYERLAHGAQEGSAEYRRVADELAGLQAAQRVHDVYGLPSRALALLSGLGINEPQARESLRTLSGGFRMRAALARLLLLSPEILLLDEPTNHLDMDSLIWLERFLAKYRGGLLIVSHDRDFLSRVTDRTIEIRGGALTQYNGPVREYLVWREEQAVTDARRSANVQAQIAQTERFIERFKAKNTKAAAAHSKEKALERLRQQLPETTFSQRESKQARFVLRASGQSGAIPLALEQCSVGYDGRVVVDNVSITVTRGQRVAIVGPNGAGKSTLLKACAGVVVPLSGTVKPGYNTVVRYYSQHRLDQLDPRVSVYDTVAGTLKDGGRNQVLSILGAFMFTAEDADKPVGVLSGGEKSRLSLAVILADPGNLLLLDEPTNHLDIESVERLADVLAQFDGTLIVVSHDEYLLSRLPGRVIEMRPGNMRDFPGTLADYRTYVEAGFGETAGEQNTPQTQQPRGEEKQDRIRRREARIKLERAIAKTEKEIEELEVVIAGTRDNLASPSNATDFELLGRLNSDIERDTARHDELLAQWEQLHRKLDENENV